MVVTILYSYKRTFTTRSNDIREKNYRIMSTSIFYRNIIKLLKINIRYVDGYANEHRV